jgi:methionine synthase II (cobalamin-independent)
MKIKIRFIEECSSDNKIIKYKIQKKTFFGWKYIKWVEEMGYGSIEHHYSNIKKQDLLKEVIQKYFKTCKKFVSITEYSSLKIY